MGKRKHIENEESFKGLKVNDGVKQQPSISPDAVHRFKQKRKKVLSAKDYVNGIIHQDRNLLSQAITIIESSLEKHRKLANEIISLCLPYTGNSIRIGITGIPGVGKSTFIEAIGETITSQNHKLAVLAIDPSSERSRGSILGDKTRMEKLVNNQNAYIRPSPSAGSLGGVARKTRESILLAEAAGFDVIFIETVGVGQSEVAVHSMVDCFLLLMLGGAGDELQGIKRGIMEMADIMAITKSDGDNEIKARQAKVQYQNALHLFPASPSGWVPTVVTCSAQTGSGLAELWELIGDFISNSKSSGFFSVNRKEQSRYWMYEGINESLLAGFYENEVIRKELQSIEKDVLSNKINSFEAASKLLRLYKKQFTGK